MDPADLLHDLNPAQREAVTTDSSPLCIVAGAGSGKTRVLTRRIGYRTLTGTADAPHVLALTFTRKAAGELRQRLAAVGVREQVVAGTFHSVAYAQLRRRWADRGEAAPNLLESKIRILVPILGRAASGKAAVQAADAASEIEWAKARLIPASQYELEATRMGRTPPISASAMAAVYERYETDKRRRGLVDFEDLLGLCARALETDADFAAGQRWRFRHLFVDEFQDVNPAQFRLLKGWLGDRGDLCVVGDPNQAIYSWNGADPRLLNGFDRLFPDATTVRLDDNYRSTPQVLAVANATLSAGGVTSPPLRANRPEGPVPTVTSYDTDVAEARGVAARIREAHRPGAPWSHVAVLLRTNAQSLAFEKAFRAAAIPYRVRGGGSFLSQPEVRDALRIISRSPASVPFTSTLHDIDESLQEPGGTEERRLNLEALVQLGREYAALDIRPSAAGFAAWLAATVKGDEPDHDSADAVDIVTFHRAKGLEWPIVFVTGLEKGFVPIARADSPEAEAEERRLLYVALTRSHEVLHCSWAARRTFGERTMSRTASPWLRTIEAAAKALQAGGPSADWRRFLAEERTKLRSTAGGRRATTPPGPDVDPEVLAALKAWRSRAAKAANVPAYVIFHDITLAAVASAKPTDRTSLLAVPGLGPVKAERYGADLLAVVSDHGRTA